jgi:type I restriction enzyme, S subunit
MPQHNTPKLRFPEFSGAWEEKKLRDVFKIGSGRDYKHLNEGNIPVYGTGGIMTYVDDFLYEGESIGIGRKGTIDKPVFLTGKFWTVDTLFYTHSFENSIPKFVYNVFQNINWRSHNEASGVPSLSKNTIEGLISNFPTLPEQQKIASFLSATDKKLEQLQQKKTLLEQYKKGMMQKLFSQQIRFKDDEGKDFPEWRKEKLGNLVSITSGTSPSEYKLSDSDLIPFIKVEELNNCDKYQFVSRFYTNSHKNLVSKNSIIFPKRGAAIFNNKIRLAGTPLLMDSNLMALTANYKIAPEFLYYKLMKEQLFKIADTSTLPQINNKHIEPYIIPLPTIAEQIKIADFLTAIDAKIAAVSAQVDAAKGFKKGLLQQMFV